MLGKTLDVIGFLKAFDPELAAMMGRELGRQQFGLELIASENFASPAVMAAMGSVLTNKYAEGLPGKRYYGGCEFVDEMETLCIERAKALFGAEFANVQPHSGAQANMAVQLAFLQPGDTFLGMSLANGGHLSHGSPANISGKYFNAVSYVELLTVVLFCWLFFKALGLAFKAAWGTAKIVASILFTIAVPMLFACLAFAGGLLLLVPLALIGIAFGLLKAIV